MSVSLLYFFYDEYLKVELVDVMEVDYKIWNRWIIVLIILLVIIRVINFLIISCLEVVGFVMNGKKIFKK